MLIMGAPGAGKGTQATALAEAYSVPAISTGDIFRANIRNATELGVKVKAIIEAGEYVPDDVTEAIVADRLAEEDCASGFLLDGFPRTMHQVHFLDRHLSDAGRRRAGPPTTTWSAWTPPWSWPDSLDRKSVV